jgi:subtilisin family serine protease
MVRILAKYSLFILLSLSYSSYARGQQYRASQYAPDEVIIKMKGDRRGGQAQAFVSKAQSEKGLNLKNSFGRMGMYHFGLKPGQNLDQTMRELRNDPDVEYVEPNYYLNKLDVDGFSETMSAADMANTPAATQNTASSVPVTVNGINLYVNNVSGSITGTSVPIVAVIDTGMDVNHPVFTQSNAVWQNSGEAGNDGNGNSKSSNGVDDDGNGYVDDVNGWNFVASTNNVFDNNGHGTHVAGTVLGVGLNIYAGSGNIGQSPIKIMPLKFLNGSGSGKTSDAIKAIYYAVNNGAHVMNNSWGGYSYSASLHEAVTYAYNAGVSFVAAAGNETNDNDATPIYPASYNVPNVISVAASTSSDSLASFSNFGRNSVNLASPGSRIYSTIPGTAFGASSGTSMASPIVAGLAAIIVKQQPTILGYQIKELILENTDAVGSLATKVQTQGRLNTLDTINATNSVSVLSSQPSYSFVNTDRGPASAGGCGTVSTLMQGGASSAASSAFGAPGTESWGIFVFLALMLLPVVVISYMKSLEPESRRRHERFHIDSEVKIKVGDRELVASVSSISLGGVQLNTNALLEQGGVLKMQIQSPDGKDLIDVEGRVVWSEANRSYGVQFQEARQSTLEKISGWTQALNKV